MILFHDKSKLSENEKSGKNNKKSSDKLLNFVFFVEASS
jgi:hypothetical protein